ncbi:LysR family transcriptional regulator [Orrella marina]|uniref:LysR family transcriptional regulator n=1 Tax=Orrella marina TaxID=2163011 RepID=A0A2R4XIN1_9BURK|nr:LysR family transcriptional regulator [Orrella marina]AWB33574.1 LysR family transcriptional regulator [Orrella marina]
MPRHDDHLDLRALSAFTRIARTGSFHETARQLNVSASALSQVIRNLESDLGQPLFDRSSRPVSLTRFGEQSLPAIQRLVDEASALRKRLLATGHHTPRNLRLGCVDSFAATVGPSLIRGLDTHENSLQLYSGLAPDISRQIMERYIDFAVSTDPMTEQESVRCVPLFRESWLAIYPQGQSPENIGASANLQAATRNKDFIRYSLRSRIGVQIERFVVHHGVRANRRFEFDETETLLSLVAAGMGWAISSALCLLQSRHSLDRVDVRELAGNLQGGREFYLLWRDDADERLARLLIQMIRQIIAHTILPGIRQALPGLSDQALVLTLNE